MIHPPIKKWPPLGGSGRAIVPSTSYPRVVRPTSRPNPRRELHAEAVMDQLRWRGGKGYQHVIAAVLSRTHGMTADDVRQAVDDLIADGRAYLRLAGDGWMVATRPLDDEGGAR